MNAGEEPLVKVFFFGESSILAKDLRIRPWWHSPAFLTKAREDGFLR